MKIAIDARPLEDPKTGIGRYLSNLLKFWKNNNECEFCLYFRDKVPDDGFWKNENFELKLLKNPFGFSSNFFFQHFLLPYQIKKDKVDFFFSPFYLKPIYCPVKSAIVLHDISYEAHPEWFNFKSQFILRTLSKFSAGTADLIFTVSNFSKEEIIKYYKTSPEKITVTYLGVSFGIIDSIAFNSYSYENVGNNSSKIKAIREKHNIRNKFILCVGSIFNRRHISEIISSFKKIVNDYKGIQSFEFLQFLIIGKNHTYPFMDIDGQIKIANESLGREAVIRLDFVDEEDLQIFYGLCETVIYLSDYEGFGLPLIEAQFFGKPVIASYNSSLVEVGGNSVEFVKNNTVDEIYRSLKKVLSNEGYKKKLIELGNKNIKRFSWEKCSNETLEQILNKK